MAKISHRELMKGLRGKAPADLQDEIVKLRKEQFSIRMQASTGQTVKPSEYGRVRKAVARMKTIAREKQMQAGSK